MILIEADTQTTKKYSQNYKKRQNPTYQYIDTPPHLQICDSALGLVPY